MIRGLITFLLFGAFSCTPKEPNLSIKSLPDSLEAGWQGEKVCEILEENDQLRVLQCTFPPNVGHEKHVHKPHFGYTLKGSTFKIVTDDTTRVVSVPTGTNFSKDELSVHEVLNVGDSTAVFLIIEPK